MEDQSRTSNLENPSLPTPKKQKSGFFIEILKFTVIAIVIIVPFRIYIAQPFIVSGASMDPTFMDGEYLIVDQLSLRFEDPHRGEVIIFKYPKDTTKYFIKRVIGLPGEQVEINAGKVKIFNTEHPDGMVLSDNYVASINKKSDNFSITLGLHEYFVMGDNRIGSLDSRSWGALPEKLIVGRPLVRVLPVSKAGVFPGDIRE